MPKAARQKALFNYFSGKDALLSSLSSLFDDKYEELMNTLDPERNSYDKLLYLSGELFTFIENSVSVELMSRMYATQLTTTGNRHLMDQSRTYFKLLRRIAAEGQERGQIVNHISPAEVSRIYAMCERALIYDWCLRGGEYSLASYGREMMPFLLERIKKQEPIGQ